MDSAELKAAEEKTAAAAKRLREMADQLEDRRLRALDRAATMTKWLLASLLALNAGALLALQDSTLASAPGARLAFLIGIVLAVLSGLATQIEGDLIGEFSEKLQNFVLDHLGGTPVAEAKKSLPKTAMMINAARVASPVFLISSLAAFVQGASLAGNVTPLF